MPLKCQGSNQTQSTDGSTITEIDLSQGPELEGLDVKSQSNLQKYTYGLFEVAGIQKEEFFEVRTHIGQRLWELNEEQNLTNQTDFDDRQQFIYSTHHFDYKNEQRRKRPALLLVHGFQGSCVQFYWLISKLRHDFDVTTIDLLGMGCSGRAPFELRNKTTNSAIFYFCHSIEAWMQETRYREKCLNGQYTFMAHSLGGYLASHYVMNYPQSVAKLILLSPAGLTA